MDLVRGPSSSFEPLSTYLLFGPKCSFMHCSILDQQSWSLGYTKHTESKRMTYTSTGWASPTRCEEKKKEKKRKKSEAKF